MNPTIPDDKLNSIRNALFQGQKIEAIKIHREATGMGLAESKAAVEKMEEQLRQESPDRFAKGSGAGCLGLVLMLAGIGAAAGWWAGAWG